MRALLSLRHIQVENANAIAGLTYGFPAISSFLGFTHALSRSLQKDHDVSLGGCAIICHQHHTHAHQPAGWGDYVFALTRNPLTKEGKTAPFVEEGRMHLCVTLLIECDFDADDLAYDTDNIEQGIKLFEAYVHDKAVQQRLAGGLITQIGQVEFCEVGSQERFERKALLSCLPGFVLVDRSDLLSKHHQQNLKAQPNTDMLDAWLDFSALKFRAEAILEDDAAPTEATQASWNYVRKPDAGWLVPMATGYKAISPLYDNAAVARTRDSTTPFRFVELIYGVGEWISPHRVQTLQPLFWRYHLEGEWYRCNNTYKPDNMME